MGTGEYCARHGVRFGNVVPCRQCENERYREQLDALAIADGWDDPCGRAMKPLMESTLQDLVASGPPDKEWQRLKRIEAAAMEVVRLDSAPCDHDPISTGKRSMDIALAVEVMRKALG